MCKKVCGNCKYSTIKKREFYEQILHVPVCHLIGVSENGEEEFDIDDYIEGGIDYIAYTGESILPTLFEGITLDINLWNDLLVKIEKCLRTNIEVRKAWYESKIECEMWEGK